MPGRRIEDHSRGAQARVEGPNEVALAVGDPHLARIEIPDVEVRPVERDGASPERQREGVEDRRSGVIDIEHGVADIADEQTPLAIGHQAIRIAIAIEYSR